MKRSWLIITAIGVAAVIVIALGGVKAWQIYAMVSANATMVPPPESVSSAVAREDKWQDTLTSVGSVDPQNGGTLAAEGAGAVAEIAVPAGSAVAEGGRLIRLDTSSEDALLGTPVWMT